MQIRKTPNRFALSLVEFFFYSQFQLLKSLDRRGVWRWSIEFIADFRIETGVLVLQGVHMGRCHLALLFQASPEAFLTDLGQFLKPITSIET